MFGDVAPGPSKGDAPVGTVECGEPPSWEDARALSYLLQASGLGHWRYDTLTDRLECSKGCKASLGLTPHEEVSTFTALLERHIHPDDRAVVRNAIGLALGGSDEYLAAHRILMATGEVRWILARGRVCRAQPERPIIVGITIDITDHKRIEAEREQLIADLAAERARLRALVEHLPAAVILGDAAGRVVLANRAVNAVFPLPPLEVPVDAEELYRRWCARHPDGRPVEPQERPLSRALRGETVPGEELRFVQADGSEAWVRLSGAPIRDEAGRVAGAVVIASEISEQKRADVERESLLQSLERSEERYRLAALATDDAIYDWDVRSDRVTVNRMFSHAFETIGCLDSWGELIHPDDRQRVLTGLHAALDRGEHHWHDEYRFAKGDGSWLTISDRGYVVYDAAGRPIRMVGAMQDVTTRRRQEEFERQLIGIVSHDLKNPLNTILMAAGMVASSEEIGERAVRNTVRIQGAAERASRMIRDLLDFTRARVGGGIPIERRRVEVGALVRELVEEMRLGHPDRSILLEAAGDLTSELDPDRLAQVLTNLTENALKYSSRGSPVRVSLDGTDSGTIVLRVHNHGPPIAADLLPRIFEPLQRGSSALGGRDRSVGLGLYIVKQLVAAHDGTIHVRSTAEDGTELAVHLPRYDAARSFSCDAAS